MSGLNFSPKTFIMLAAAAVGLFALSILLHAYESPGMNAGDKAGPGAFSTSAIGHAAVYEMLVRLGWNVERTGDNPLDRLGDEGILVAAEPTLRHLTSTNILAVDAAPNLLLVLPKWRGERDPRRSAWVEEVDLLPYAPVMAALNLADSKANIVRAGWPDRWRTNALDAAPTGAGTVQLMTSKRLKPLVASGDGMLVGEMWHDDRRIIVLSDPDVMANHGIGDGDNALFMLALFDRAAYGDRDVPIVFDEAVHGVRLRGDRDSPLRLLFEFPFIVVTLLACAAALILVLAGAGRFGPAALAGARLGFGKAGLIDNSARLMHHSGHHAEVLRRYVRMTVNATANDMHVPPGLDASARAAWLDRIGTSRRLELSCGDIMRRSLAYGSGESDLRGLMHCAADIHRWRGEMLAPYRAGRAGGRAAADNKI